MLVNWIKKHTVTFDQKVFTFLLFHDNNALYLYHMLFVRKLFFFKADENLNYFFLLV